MAVAGRKSGFVFPTKSQPPFGHTAPLCGGPLCCRRRAETTMYRDRILHACGLCDLSQSDGIAQAFKGLEGPLTFAFLLSRQQAIIPLFLIKRPLQEKMVDDGVPGATSTTCAVSSKYFVIKWLGR